MFANKILLKCILWNRFLPTSFVNIKNVMLISFRMFIKRLVSNTIIIRTVISQNPFINKGMLVRFFLFLHVCSCSPVFGLNYWPVTHCRAAMKQYPKLLTLTYPVTMLSVQCPLSQHPRSSMRYPTGCWPSHPHPLPPPPLLGTAAPLAGPGRERHQK